MVHIVIPMAGAGSRFSKEGYNVPKPFIEFKGKMMIEHVLDGLECSDATYSLIIQKSFKHENKAQLDKLCHGRTLNLFTVDGLTQGASMTALSVHKLINNNKPVLFADCDNIFAPGVVERFVDDAKKRRLDGSLVVFDSVEPCFSFAATDEAGRVTELREKEPISNHAICGLYYFGRGCDFVDATITTVIYGQRQKGEFYMSGVYNPMINNNKNIGVFEIKNTDWICVGTPKQLEIYLEK